MKTKKFKFEQTVIEVVETKYTYKIEAKSYAQAEKKLKDIFEKKIQDGLEFSPVKKYLTKVKNVETSPVTPEEAGHSTLSLVYIPAKKEELAPTVLYNNQYKIWNLMGDTTEEQIDNEKISTPEETETNKKEKSNRQ